MRYGSYNCSPRSSPPTLPPLTPATHTLMADPKTYLIDTPPTPAPLCLIDDFDSRCVRFGPLTASKQGGMKSMEIFYEMPSTDPKSKVLVKPVITTPKLRVPFDTKPFPGSETLNLVMNLPESANLFHTLRRLDGLVLAIVHHLKSPTKSIDCHEPLQTKLLNIRPDGKYDATFKMKLSEKTPIKDITSDEVIAANKLLQGDAYAQFSLAQVWLMPNGTFGLQARALRVKWMPFVSKMEALGDWNVPEEKKTETFLSQFAD